MPAVLPSAITNGSRTSIRFSGANRGSTRRSKIPWATRFIRCMRRQSVTAPTCAPVHIFSRLIGWRKRPACGGYFRRKNELSFLSFVLGLVRQRARASQGAKYKARRTKYEFYVRQNHHL